MSSDHQLAARDGTLAENRCRNCGAFVSRDFARVFGNNHNEVYGCLECLTAGEVKRGGARAPNADLAPVVPGVDKR